MYASRNWWVFPLIPGGKTPLTTHGFKDASIDPKQIMSWWTKTPDANIGISCGPSGLLVIDVDPRNLDEEGTVLASRFSSTVCVYTGGGGSHFYYKAYDMGGRTVAVLSSGVDVKGHGGYVVAPPSVTEGPYTWVSGGILEPPPEWLQTLLESRQRPSKVFGPRTTDPLDDRPGSLYNASANWEEILEPHGWTKTYVGTENQQYWTRPGKDQGTSAVSGGEDGDLFWCWSTSTGLDANQTYNKFGLLTALNFDGDFTEAAKSIAGLYTPTGGVKVTSYGEPTALHVQTTGTRVLPGPNNLFLEQLQDYTARQTDAYSGYSYAAGLSLLSVVAGKSYADLSTGPLNLNTYIMLCGPSSLSRKSTVQGIAVNLLEEVLPDSFLADRMTGEGAIYDLAARSHRSSLWTPDEFGVILSQIYTRDFMKPLEEMFLTLYGKDKYDYRRADVSVSLRGVVLSILGASTPESVSLAGPNVSLGGLLPRFGVVFPDTLPEPQPLQAAHDLAQEKQGLVNQLRDMLRFCSSGQRVTFSPEAMEVLNNLESELSGIATAIRLPVVGYKTSALLALARLSSTVSGDEAHDASLLVREFAEGSARLDTYLHRKTSDLELDRLIANVTQKLKENGGTQYRQVISRTLKLDPVQAKKVRDCMIEWGLLTVSTESSQETWNLNE